MSNEIIVEAGAEGGSLTLYGVRNGRDWLYSSRVTESYSDDDDPAVVEPPSKVVKTWNSALKLLDNYQRNHLYQWNHLYPVKVHPEFREKVLKAVVARSKRDDIDHRLQDWQRVCGMSYNHMMNEDLYVDPIFLEIEIPKFGSTQGRLFAANPSFAKPSNIAREDWVFSLLQQVKNQVRESKSVLAVPRSFWPLSREALDEYAKSEGIECVDLMDEWDGPLDFGGMTPVESMRQIIDHLQRGQDVIILSHSKKGSDFVHAILYIISQEYAEHPAKMWCGIAQDGGVELTQFQRGYLYGLMNATGSFGLEQLKNAFRERRVS